MRLGKRPPSSMLRLAAVCVLGTISAGCTTFDQPLQYPSLSVTNARVLEAGIFEQKFAIELSVQNPNSFDLPVKGLDYTLHLAGEKFAEGVTAQAFSVPAFGESSFETQVSTNLMSTIRHLSHLIKDAPKEVDYLIEGKLKLSLPLVRSIPFSESGLVDLGRD